MTTRREGREAAMQLLYQIELSGDASEQAMADFWAAKGERYAESRTFCDELVGRVLQHRQEIDPMIDAAAANWQLARIARLDLSLLRLGVCEMLFPRGLAPEIVINEAVELARKYSDSEASAFVNAVLDRIAHDSGLIVES
jgi:N utilization substance protein B